MCSSKYQVLVDALQKHPSACSDHQQHSCRALDFHLFPLIFDLCTLKRNLTHVETFWWKTSECMTFLTFGTVAVFGDAAERGDGRGVVSEEI